MKLVVNKKMQNDYFSKKESIFHLWMLEFEEFKERLLSINELKKLIATFDNKTEDLKALQNIIIDEELMYLRMEDHKHVDNTDKFKKVINY